MTAFFERRGHGHYHFPNQDHTFGSMLCDYLDRDPRVRAVGHTVRDKVMLLQLDASDPDLCLQDASRRIIEDLQSLRTSLLSQLGQL